MSIALIFMVLLLAGVPVAFVLGLTSVFYLLVSGNYDFFLTIPQRMISAPNNFSLLAIPLFVLAGEIMNSGGITKRLADFSRALVAHLRGGLAYVNILVSAFLSAIVGSANAVAAIQSTFMVPEMKKDNYDEDYSAAVTAGGSIMGPIIPPSLIFILYGVAASTSIGALFLAGIIPGIMLTLGFFALAFIYAKKKGFPVKERASMQTVFKSFLMALPALLVPFLIIGGIFSGQFTPTEAGAIGSVIAFIVGMYVYKELKISNMPNVLIRTGVISASVLIINSTASVFSWTITMEGIPQMIAEGLTSISEKPWVILLIINILLLIVGMFLEPLSAIIILVPILLPVVEVLGIDPIHFGVVVSLNLTIGLITPPVGLVLFVVSGITKVSFVRLSKAIIPFALVAIVVLLIITYIPAIVTFIPEFFLS
ncbi:TRAP transporter large permease [Virgibacillus sp. W0181]|uniref:TRAP transporter large permease n=1 Tax=Virgibacillus sp. W0181 TaxID=3391581 RepID=UPI003F466174